MRKIPFVDLKAQYAAIKTEIDAAIAGVLDNTAFILGAPVAEFEAAFAAYCEADECVGCGNGTDALVLALRALGIGAGDEVITAANTFIATAGAVSQVGGRPVFVDVDEHTALIDVSKIEAAITDKTRAIIPVHLRGAPADVDAVLDVARRHDLRVIEDAAQAHGARYRGKRVGALADVGTFSFYPAKNLGAYGDGGAIVTRSPDLAETLRRLRDHGRVSKQVHEIEGVNSRLDGLQAAVLSVKLAHLDDWNAARRAAAARYAEALRDIPGVRLPQAPANTEPVWHLYPICVDRRDDVMAALQARGVGCGIHYAVPLHLQPALAHLGYERGAFPVAERLADTMISLPMYPELSADDVAYVADALRAAV